MCGYEKSYRVVFGYDSTRKFGPLVLPLKNISLLHHSSFSQWVSCSCMTEEAKIKASFSLSLVGSFGHWLRRFCRGTNSIDSSFSGVPPLRQTQTTSKSILDRIRTHHRGTPNSLGAVVSKHKEVMIPSLGTRQFWHLSQAVPGDFALLKLRMVRTALLMLGRIFSLWYSGLDISTRSSTRSFTPPFAPLSTRSLPCAHPSGATLRTGPAELEFNPWGAVGQELGSTKT